MIARFSFARLYAKFGTWRLAAFSTYASAAGYCGLAVVMPIALMYGTIALTGFALGISYAMNYFWACVLVAWLIKLFIVRYMGMNAYKRAIPFFFGLILGDYTVGALWSLVGLLLGVPTYKIYI